MTLQSIRERALSTNTFLFVSRTLLIHSTACRSCIYALHAELTRLLEVQHAFRQLSYFDILGRSLLTIQLTRITLSLPIALEKAMLEQSIDYRCDKGDVKVAILPRQVTLLIRGVDVALERMERILK
jgi:hypothetical protein